MGPTFSWARELLLSWLHLPSFRLGAAVLTALMAETVAILAATTPAAHILPPLAPIANLVTIERMNLGWIDWAFHE